jgi:hypothetical protein
MNGKLPQPQTSEKYPRRPARPAPQATADARRRAAVILEVLAGVRTACEAAGVLKISTNHYYLLERKALGGLVSACESAPHRGRVTTAEHRVEQLERELAACRRECQRQAALVRAAQRALGLPCVAAPTETPSRGARARGGKTSTRRRRTQVRALRAAHTLEKSLANAPPAAVEPDNAAGAGQSPLVTQESSHEPPRTQADGPGTH